MRIFCIFTAEISLEISGMCKVGTETSWLQRDIRIREGEKIMCLHKRVCVRVRKRGSMCVERVGGTGLHLDVRKKVTSGV